MNKKDMNLLLPAITLILAIAAYFVCSNLLIPPIKQNMAQITAFDQDIAKANGKLDSISAADKSMLELSDLVNNLLIAVPDNINSPDLITEIEAIANQNQVQLPSLSPPISIAANAASNTSAPGYVTNLSILGSFQNISSFINSLETSIRYSRINNLSLSSTDEGLTASINFSVFSRPVVASSTEVNQ